MPTVRIDTPTDGLDLTLADGWAVDHLDLGSPDIREVEIDAPAADGMIDTTRFVGARDVIVTGTMLPDVLPIWQMRDQLAAFLSPTVRSTITFQEHPDAPAKILRNCRALRIPRRVVDRQADGFLAAFRAPWGVIESAVEYTSIVRASASDQSVIGVSFPIVFPLAWPAAPIVGATTIVNAGNHPAYPILRLYGPMSDRIEVLHVESGRAIVLDGTTIPAGSFIEINTRTAEVNLNGDSTASRRQFVVFPDTSFWSLPKGTQTVRLIAETFDSPAQLHVIHRHAEV